MKVIHVLNTGKFSGAENVALCICEGLMERGVESIYASRNGSIEDVAAKREVKFIGLDDISVCKVRRMIRDERPDVIHAHDMYAGVICSIATIGLNCRLIITVHNNFVENRKISIKSVAFIIAMIRAWRVFWVSENAMKGYKFERFFRNKCDVLGNIANVGNVNINEKRWDVVFVGRLEPVKDPMRMVRVVSIIKEKMPDIKVAVVGDGGMKIMVEKKIAEMGLQDNVEMLGYRDDAVDIMAASKVMLMTSMTEGIPMVALEAMAVGVPVVGTNVGGMKEVVNERWLCERDIILSSKIIELLENGCDDYVWHKGMSREVYFDRLMKVYE